MAKTKVVVKPDPKGIGELLRADFVQAELMRRAGNVASAAGPGHDVKNTTTKRARATVMTVTDEAMLAEAVDHTLTSAISAGRR